MLEWTIFHLLWIKTTDKEDIRGENEREKKFEQEIMFMPYMGTYTEEALQSKEYLIKYYDCLIRSSNR